MLKIPAEYGSYISQQNERTFLAKFLPASLLGVSNGIYQRALVDESELRWGSKIDQKMDAVHETLCTIPARNSNQYAFLMIHRINSDYFPKQTLTK
jgi:hypothetical protein